ncbi:motility associated factor glycosyltransferase family protein [Shewanella sp. UCD-KL12]|uniref:motility associated factor glycosyltransferase family protein n=1 Tax=Shewanella sp. UCD-KL12 TaxID=1917163 RepID=UPI0009708529|nr:6-hydroxymethylpterin diphosphokinase MptE-like protein [Shewanella sp. UCD-KL12]
MTELFSTNLQIIQQRWPALASALKFQSLDELDANLVTGNNQTISVNGIQLSSRHDRMAEAQLFINQLPLDCEQVTVYGVGMGDVPSILTDNKQIKNIDICPLNLGLFALLLSYTDQREWLTDSRIRIIELPNQHQIAEPYIAVTPDLLLADNENATLRDLLALENNREFANKQHQIDDPKLIKRFNENKQYLDQDPDAATLRLTHTQHNTLVIGSGPSLEAHYDYLKAQRALPIGKRPLMIAVDTAFKALSSQGITPDILVSIESNITLSHLPDEIPDSVTLVYFPRIPSNVIEHWPGPRFNAYSKGAIYNRLDAEYPKLRLFTNGSVIHPAIDLAAYLNSWEITLFGCDFSYPNNKTHAFWKDGSLGPKAENAKHWVINGHGDRVGTDLNFRAYLRSLEHYIRFKPQIKFYQSSLDGARIHGAQYRECKV